MVPCTQNLGFTRINSPFNAHRRPALDIPVFMNADSSVRLFALLLSASRYAENMFLNLPPSRGTGGLFQGSDYTPQDPVLKETQAKFCMMLLIGNTVEPR